MVSLIGRRVQMVCGAMFPIEEGVVYADNPEGVWVRFEDDSRQYMAKYRLLSNELPERDVFDARIGVYLIKEVA
jgi:hypothetical protein